MWREFIDYLVIKQSGFFDPAYYLLQYPDCRRADVDPLWHFVRYGWKEGRNPSALFDTEYYLRTNPDVLQAGINPLIHYLLFGCWEGRSPHPSSAQVLHSVPLCGPFKPINGFRRLLYNLGAKIYWRVPSKYRQTILYWLYSHLGFFFRGTPDYEAWRRSRSLKSVSFHFGLIDLEQVPPAEHVDGSIGIHLHVFYSDVVKELSTYLRNVPFEYDLYVSVPDRKTEEVCYRLLKDLPFCQKLTIRQVPNRGRDIAPLICAFGQELSQYTYVAHFHTKKSLYNQGATEGWREYLYRSLLGSPQRVRKILSLIQGKEPCGIVYPQTYVLLPYWAHTWLANRELAKVWALRLGITEIPRGYFDYPTGSMFWARAEALLPLFKAGITLSDFPEESGQTDGTLAHTIERLFVLCSLKQGLRPGILRDEEHPSWSPWRLDRYINRPYASLVDAISSPSIRLIAFDVFDTLVCRPLLDPETVKRIVARRAGGEAGSLYLRYRAIAEQQARQARGQDVGVDEIYTYLGQLSGLSEMELADLRNLEEEIEEALQEPRWEVLSLYKEALSTGKPVVLMTDMFLPRERIERILHQNGIDGWQDLFVSNDVGLRKDRGKLYDYVLARYKVEPAEFLMIGDDERSDIQIPCDLGASFIHVLRPVELARGLPRWTSIVAAHERRNDLDAELTLGLVLRKNFGRISFPSFDPESLVQVTPYDIGYSLVGPLLVSFANWLIHQARSDGIERLYFLSREGKLIKEVFDRWCVGLSDVPISEYLVVSRRAAGVACIKTFEDILNIARMVYFPNTLENFLYTRYGLTLNDERWTEVERITGLSRFAQVSVPKEGRIDHLIPLLRVVEADIRRKAEEERPGLLRYLLEKGLGLDDLQAVVDVGYGGSVQGYLNRLLPRKVHGYYLMTDERSMRVIETCKVIVRGCFCENVAQTPHAPAIYRYSFEVEKLLSSSEPQVEFYEIDSGGELRAHYRDLQPEEWARAHLQEEIRRGVLDFADDARRIREKVLPDFQPSCWTAQLLIEEFLESKSPRESEFLSKILLDDHYCGRGLV